MSTQVIDQLIINSPYEEPQEYWKYNRETQGFDRTPGRRAAGYVRATASSRRSSDDPGEFIEIELVNKIRPRVKKWREAGYPNVTGTTKKLFEYWHTPEHRIYQPFWCQMEAVETAIWLTEASDADKQGIEVPQEGEWVRQCFKLATGTGKTTVMAMLIAWQALNKMANPKDQRFSKNILIVAPGITVKDRLQVLLPSDEQNYYEEFGIVPPSMWQELLSATIVVKNWHALAPLNENYGPKVVKKGPEGDDAFVRRTLPEFGGASGILVINDEAHHCHRPTESEDVSEKEKATIWVDGIDKVHRARGVIRTYDLSATPFKPTGGNNQGELLFDWIVSDFGLNDAIESGLVKTPKIAVRDDSINTDENFRSKLFHLYPHVKDDLNRRADPTELPPDLVSNALNILAADWLKVKEDWQEHDKGTSVPPVLIAISNRTETAARLEHFLTQGYCAVSEIGERDKLLRIDQDALDKVESEEDQNLTGKKKDLIQQQRDRFNSVGKDGKPGEQVQCVIGVNMLSEGWDARTVTHILGLRAFTSQLLCEQVVGRGLRRRSYELNDEGLFDPEYVTVFGVPFTFLPVESSATTKPREEKPKTKIEPVLERTEREIKWPHVLRVDYKLSYYLDIDWDKIEPLVLSPQDAPSVVEVAPVIEGKPNLTGISEVNLERLSDQHRVQTAIFRATANLVEKFKDNWAGDTGNQIAQLSRIITNFLDSDKLEIKLPQFEGTTKLRQVMIALNMQKIVNHLEAVIKQSSAEEPIAILDSARPVRSTATAPAWYTTKPTQPVQKSQLSHIVIDSRWEGLGLEFERDRIPGLQAWVKNDHIGFEIKYLWQGQLHTYYPDHIIKFEDNRYILLEVKGQKIEQDKAKWAAAEEWVRAVNANSNFGNWEFKALEDLKDLYEVVR